MKILFVTFRPPLSSGKGDQIISYHQIRELSGKHEISLISFFDGHLEEPVLDEELRNFCKRLYFLKVRPSLQRILRTVLRGLPVQVSAFYDKRLQQKLDAIINREKPDLVHVQTLRVAEYFKSYQIPKTLDFIDAISENIRQRGLHAPKFTRAFFKMESILLQRYERRLMNWYDNSMVVSQRDSRLLSNLPHVNPNGTFVTFSVLEPYGCPVKDVALVFHGNMSYFPNVSAVLDFCDSIFPILKEKFDGLRLYIVGRDPHDRVSKLHDGRSIIVTGAVDSVIPYLIKSQIGVYPLTSGTGMQNKVLECMACGIPAVCSPVAVGGLPGIVDGEQVLVANDPREWVSKISELLRDEKRRNELGLRGQEFVWSGFSWTSNAERLESVWMASLR